MPYHPYTVLAVVQSKSNPDKTYEIRLSNQDGTTYCTCMSCIMSFHKNDGKADCKHLREYIKNNPNTKVIVMDQKCYEEFKRAVPILAVKRIKDTDVKRVHGENL